MFTDYFAEQSNELQKALEQRVQKRGVQVPGKEKDLRIYKEFYEFLKDHLPVNFSLAMGKVRSRKHLLNRSTDVLIYHKWCRKFLDMTGGCVLVDHLYSFLSLESDLSTAALLEHAGLTLAMKSLYAGEVGAGSDDILPVYSVLLSYKSSIPLLSHRVALEDYATEKEVPLNSEIDMVCVLDQGLILKDWENGGQYKIIEIGKDTLLWFYILLLEYLDRDGKVGLDPRDYLKEIREYKEY